MTDSIVVVTDSTDKLPKPVGKPPSSKNAVGEDNEHEETDAQLQRELEQMRENFLRQMQRENEKRMLQVRKEAEAEFRKQRIQLYKEFECEDYPLEEEENAVGGASELNREPAQANLAKVWMDKESVSVGQNKPVQDSRGAYPKNSTPNNATQFGNVENVQRRFPPVLEDVTPLRNPQLPFTKADKPAEQPLSVNRLNNPQVSNAFRGFEVSNVTPFARGMAVVPEQFQQWK